MKKNIAYLVIGLLLLILIGAGIWLFFRQSTPTTPIAEHTEGEPTLSDPTASEPAESPGYLFPTSVDQINWEDRKIFKSGLVSGSQSVINELPLASSYYISLEIPEDLISGIKGHLVVRYFNAEDVTLNRVYFRLFPNFQGGLISLSNITLDGEPAATTLESLDPRVEENPQPTALRVDLAS